MQVASYRERMLAKGMKEEEVLTDVMQKVMAPDHLPHLSSMLENKRMTHFESVKQLWDIYEEDLHKKLERRRIDILEMWRKERHSSIAEAIVAFRVKARFARNANVREAKNALLSKIAHKPLIYNEAERYARAREVENKPFDLFEFISEIERADSNDEVN